jgi:ketosteroid isomerase-like protein
MDTKELAKAFTALCAKGEFDAAGQKFWSEDVVSREPMPGDMAKVEGRKAVLGKGEWWYANHTVHDAKVEGPYVHGNQFAVRFTFDVTPKDGQRTKMDELGVYTVANGKIVDEAFFYSGA